jgi:hypothetical protein
MSLLSVEMIRVNSMPAEMSDRSDAEVACETNGLRRAL